MKFNLKNFPKHSLDVNDFLRWYRGFKPELIKKLGKRRKEGWPDITPNSTLIKEILGAKEKCV